MSTRAVDIVERRRYAIMRLPVRQAVIVPTTTAKSKRMSRKAYMRRVNDVERYLADKFGGYTAIKAQGGYVSSASGEKIEEPVIKVESYTTPESYRENAGRLYTKMNRWGRKWGQETVGYEFEDDMELIRGIG